MRVIWNGMCDPTLHLIAIALLLTGMGSMFNLNGSSSRVSDRIKRCNLCDLCHYDADHQCVPPNLIVASQNPID